MYAPAEEGLMAETGPGSQQLKVSIICELKRAQTISATWRVRPTSTISRTKAYHTDKLGNRRKNLNKMMKARPQPAVRQVKTEKSSLPEQNQNTPTFTLEAPPSTREPYQITNDEPVSHSHR